MIERIRLLDKVGEAIKNISTIVANTAVAFSKERFVQQNWVDNTTMPWKRRAVKRKSKTRERGAVLVSSGRLKRSVRKILVTDSYVVIGSDVNYAQIHNDGYRGQESVKAHTRHKYRIAKQEYTTKSGKKRKKDVKQSTGLVKVKEHERQMNMPRRRFIGASTVLNNRIERACTVRFMQAIKEGVNLQNNTL